MRWYITVRAVRDYMNILGYEGSTDGPIFDRAAIDLEDLCDGAELKREWAHDGKPRQLWLARTQIDGRVERLELTVSLQPRQEGPLPQLVRVRLKSRGGRVR
jgi:hypothetical protein